jgi:S-methylmethionine-dependent homocysteine/selenocysteine methylase
MSSENRASSTRPSGRLAARLARGETLLLEGATGTELQRRGIPATLPLWSAQALIDRPSVVRQIHEEYVAAGVDIITANSFRTTRRVVHKAGLRDQEAVTLTRQAVALAAGAAATSDHAVLVAGSIAPLEDCYAPELTPPFEHALAEHREQAAVLAEAGVDLILIETMPTAGEAEAATIAATATGLDVAVSVICGEDGRLLSGEPLAAAVHRLTPHDITAILVNCATPAVIQQALVDLVRLTDLPIGGYANAGIVHARGRWAPNPDLTPARYAVMVAEWCASGARIVGGCCGTTPAHIAAIRTMLTERARK